MERRSQVLFYGTDGASRRFVAKRVQGNRLATAGNSIYASRGPAVDRPVRDVAGQAGSSSRRSYRYVGWACDFGGSAASISMRGDSRGEKAPEFEAGRTAPAGTLAASSVAVTPSSDRRSRLRAGAKSHAVGGPPILGSSKGKGAPAACPCGAIGLAARALASSVMRHSSRAGLRAGQGSRAGVPAGQTRERAVGPASVPAKAVGPASLPARHA